MRSGAASYDLTAHWYTYASSRFTHDQQLHLSLRAEPRAGAGYYFIKSKTRNFSTDVGVAWIYEDFFGDEGIFPGSRSGAATTTTGASRSAPRATRCWPTARSGAGARSICPRSTTGSTTTSRAPRRRSTCRWSIGSRSGSRSPTSTTTRRRRARSGTSSTPRPGSRSASLRDPLVGHICATPVTFRGRRARRIGRGRRRIGAGGAHAEDEACARSQTAGRTASSATPRA